jgi:hypothetical protein
MRGVPREKLCLEKSSARRRADSANAGSVPSPAPQKTQMLWCEEEESMDENVDVGVIVFVG